MDKVTIDKARHVLQDSSSGDTSSDAVTCVQEVYEGVCKQHLLVYQDCNSNTTAANSSLEGGVVYIPSGQGSQEDNALEALAAVTALLTPSADCVGDLFSYLCLSLFGVCTDSGEVVRPSSGQCERLRTDVCVSEWERAEHFEQGSGGELISLNGLCDGEKYELTCLKPHGRRKNHLKYQLVNLYTSHAVYSLNT